MIKIMTIPFDEARHGFNDDSLREVLQDKNLASYQGQFFERQGVAYLAVVLHLTPKGEPEISAAHRDGSLRIRGLRPWQEQLAAQDQALFTLLRAWRTKRSRADSVPPYVVFSDKDLARIAVLRPQNLGALSMVSGIGARKLDKYGDEVLAITQAQSREAPPSPSPASQSG